MARTLRRSSKKTTLQRTESDKLLALLAIVMLAAYFSILILSWSGLQILIKRILGL